MDEQKIQEKAMKMQMLEQQIMQVQKQLQAFETQLLDLDATKDSLDNLKKTERGNEMLSMLSPGIFVKTNLVDNKDVIINVGGSVAVKKNVDDAKRLVDDQIEEVKKVQMELMQDMQKMSEVMMNMEKE